MTDVRSIMASLKQAIQEDPEYAWGWQCNLAMPIHDEGVDAVTANKAAARLMSHFFDVDITKNANWPDTIANWERNAPDPSGTRS